MVDVTNSSPGDAPIQCYIKRNKKNSTFYLYLGLTSSSTTFMEEGKFLLAARKFDHGTHAKYIISLDADDFSQGSNAYVGNLRSNFFRTNFTIYDCQPPFEGAKVSRSRASRRFGSKQISPQVSAGNFEIGHVSYTSNLTKVRGPRRMLCKLQCPTTKQNLIEKQPLHNTVCGDCMVVKNKPPRWSKLLHKQLQGWCLNFRGRVTIASVKNFQLLAPVSKGGDNETILLQFGKVAGDIFTMDYRQPLSAFVAFAICLTSFGTKLACE